MNNKRLTWISSAKALIGCFWFSLLISGCSGGSNSGDNQHTKIPLGAEVLGLTLAGPLTGKTVYKLDGDINIPNCWNDSVTWTGSALYYGLSSASFTKLLAGQGLTYEPTCLLPRIQVNDDFFDIYRAALVNGAWQVFYQNIDPINSDAGASVSGSTMAYTIYNPSGDWDIFLTEMSSENVWNTPVAFAENSTCREDNAQVYANGTKIIFESTRLDGLGNTCNADSEKRTLWFSKKTGPTWSTPTLIPGAPNLGDKNTQPWVDEPNGYLYWTADTECACIRRVPWVNDAPAGSYETVITPSIQALSLGTADGKIVFVGEYSHSDEYAFFACAKATDSGDGTDPDLFNGKWQVDVDLCVIPR